ncbi:MAG TPA: helix-turn-helix transcriptional regulator [Lysobacter sp.]
MDNVRGTRLAEAMYARGIHKLRVLSTLLGVTESAISRWRHNGTMTVENVTALCVALDISVDWFLTGRGHMEMHKAQVQSAHSRIATLADQLRPHVREQLAGLLNAVLNEA